MCDAVIHTKNFCENALFVFASLFPTFVCSITDKTILMILFTKQCHKNCNIARRFFSFAIIVQNMLRKPDNNVTYKTYSETNNIITIRNLNFTSEIQLDVFQFKPFQSLKLLHDTSVISPEC